MKRFLLAAFVLVLSFFSSANAQSPLDGLDVNVSGSVAAITVQTDGKIIIGGSFTQINGVNRNNLARLNANRTLDASFNPNPNGSVYTILIQPNGSILIDGIFTLVGGLNRPPIARLQTDGTLDPDFFAPIDGWVKTIALESSGNILIGGQNRQYLARLDPITGVADSFNPMPSDYVLAIHVGVSGSIFIGGGFQTIGGISRSNFARLTNDTYAVSELTISRTSVSSQIDGSTPQFNGVRFELSTDGGGTYTFLGGGIPNLNSSKNAENAELSPNTPQANTFTLSGLNLPTGQETLIRATNSESTNEKVQSAYLLAPTASSVSISGRVLTSNGGGLSNAIVYLTGPAGFIRTSRTNSFGYYRFDSIEVGQTVVINVLSKRLQFEPRVLTIAEELSNVDFVPIGGNSIKE